MSTTTVSFSSTTRDAEIADLRRREAEARAAARRVAQRAEEERRQEEAIRRRIAAANQRINKQEERFQNAVNRLDEAARRLPDLTLSAPSLATLTSNIGQAPDKLEAYAARLTAQIDDFSQRLDAAVRKAEQVLARRVQTATAWRNAADLEQQLGLLIPRCRDAATRLHESFTTTAPLDKPDREAELEEVQAYEAALLIRLSELKQHHASLLACIASQKTAQALSGSHVNARSADEVLSRHEAKQKARMVTVLRTHLDDVLRDNDLCHNNLPGALQAQIEIALDQAHCQDYRSSITRWVAREKQQRVGIARALDLMRHAPDLVKEDHALSQRWTSLTGQLQRIASGLEDFTPNVDREYEQLRADAHRLVNTAFTKVDWVRAMTEQGFEILERADGQGLMVVDLDHPDTWLEATPIESEDGGFGAMLELMTDADALDDAQTTDDICAKLSRVAGSTVPEIATEAEVIERKHRIERRRRPRVFRQGL